MAFKIVIVRTRCAVASCDKNRRVFLFLFVSCSIKQSSRTDTVIYRCHDISSDRIISSTFNSIAHL